MNTKKDLSSYSHEVFHEIERICSCFIMICWTWAWARMLDTEMNVKKDAGPLCRETEMQQVVLIGCADVRPRNMQVVVGDPSNPA